jgi:hypothetical protein
MKKLLVLLCAATLTLGSCDKEKAADPATINSVSTDYKAFIIEFTATWCHYCGDNGYPNWDPAFANHAYKVTGISFHPADGLVDADYPESDSIMAFYGCTGFPTTGINATGNGYPSATYWDSQINPALAANAQAKAGIGISKSIEGNNMIVNTKTVFFADMTGKFNLAVYVTEDNLVYDQTITNSPFSIPGAVHNHVFRSAAGHLPFGTTIVSTSTTKGAKYDGSYTIALPADVQNRSNLHVVVVLFQVDGAGHPTAVINSNTL